MPTDGLKAIMQAKEKLMRQQAKEAAENYAAAIKVTVNRNKDNPKIAKLQTALEEAQEKMEKAMVASQEAQQAQGIAQGNVNKAQDALFEEAEKMMDADMRELAGLNKEDG